MMTIHFIRPLWLMAFIPAILYLLWVIYTSRRHNPWKKICDPHLLPSLIKHSKNTSQRFFHLTLFLLFTIAIFALAGPAWHKTKLPAYREVSSLMLVLDLSPAMLLNDLSPDRLTRAKFKIRDLIKASQNTEMGLVVFSGEAFVASPLSEDANTLAGMLNELQPQMMPLYGSDMGQGLTQALKLIKQTDLQHNDLLLITASEPTASSWDTAKTIRASGNHLNILATLPQTAATQNTIDALQQLAKLGNGTFYLFTPDSADIQRILNDYHATQTIKDQNIDHANLWQDAGPWFCLLLLPFALLVLREKL